MHLCLSSYSARTRLAPVFSMDPDADGTRFNDDDHHHLRQIADAAISRAHQSYARRPMETRSPRQDLTYHLLL